MNNTQKAETADKLKASDKWQYVGDINIEYGGTFFNLSDDWKNGYVSAVRVTDLDSSCGFDGAVLIEKITILLDSEEQNAQACSSCGFDYKGLNLWDQNDRLRLADSLMWYGRFDPANEYCEPQYEVVQTQSDGPMSFDGWKATKRVLSDNLEGYVRSKLN